MPVEEYATVIPKPGQVLIFRLIAYCNIPVIFKYSESKKLLIYLASTYKILKSMLYLKGIFINAKIFQRSKLTGSLETPRKLTAL